jgi:hypothetical protein
MLQVFSKNKKNRRAFVYDRAISVLKALQKITRKNLSNNIRRLFEGTLGV